MAHPTLPSSRACGRLSRAVALAAALGLWPGAAAADAPPGRVVSMNVCTDQLAMMLAAPGQLVSVSDLASDPLTSAMADEARAGGYRVNRGQAEEIFLMKPDLVLAGRYTSRDTVEILRRLGIEVAEFSTATSFEDVRTNLRRVGGLLGRAAEAEAAVAAFDARLAALTEGQGQRPLAALYFANGYTTGRGTLSNEILSAAGFDNLAARMGRTGGATLALERLVMAAPDLIITGVKYPGASRSEEILDHPALRSLTAKRAAVASAYWICGTPRVLDAAETLAAIRHSMGAAE